MARPKENAVDPQEVTIVMGEYPALAQIESKKVREILLLRTIGYTQKAIADRMGVTQSAVSQTLKEHDPEGRYQPNTDLRKEVVKASLGTVTLEALRHLLGKTDEMKNYTPQTLINLISKIEAIQDSLGTNREPKQDTQKALAELTSAK